VPIFFHVNYEGVSLLAFQQGLSRRSRDEAIKYAMFRVAMFWHRFILPKHFERGAKRRYKHQQRKRKYSRIKEDFARGIPYKGELPTVVKGGTVDIAFGGSTEGKARASKAIKVTTSGFKIRMRVPRYIVMRRRGNYPNMKAELSRITREEARALTKIFARDYIRYIRSQRISQQIAA
jgi:hypothetical protein